MAFLIQDGHGTMPMATFLGLMSNKYLTKSQSGTVSDGQRDEYRKLGNKCLEYSNDLTVESVQENTHRFEAVRDQLNQLNADIKARFDWLEQVAQTIENIRTVLVLVDQGIEIAAGVMH